MKYIGFMFICVKDSKLRSKFLYVIEVSYQQPPDGGDGRRSIFFSKGRDIRNPGKFITAAIENR